MELYNDYYDDELYHWGIKGMKWGVRRYQNKDGSLTSAGKKRRSLGQVVHDHKVAKKRKAAAAKARETREKNLKEAAKRKEALAKGKIPVKKMTDEELAESMKRLENEAKYKQKVLETSPGKRMAHEMWDKAIVPGISEGAKQLIKDTLIKKGSSVLGLEKKEVKSAYDKMKEEHDMSNWKRKMSENADYHTKRAERLKKEADERAKAEAQKKVDEHNTKEDHDRWQNEGNWNQKGDGSYKSKQTEISGTPIDKETDSGSSSGKKSSSSNKQETKSEPKVDSGNSKKTESESGSGLSKNLPATVAPNTSMNTVRNNSDYKKTANAGSSWIEDNATGEILVKGDFAKEKD